MTDCRCKTIATRMAGDGCEECNPAYALEIARERIAELEAAISEFAKGQAWADELWKSQAHIAPLFEIADFARRKEREADHA